MQGPCARFLFLWLLATNGEFQLLQSFNVVPRVHSLTFRGRIYRKQSVPCQNSQREFDTRTQVAYFFRPWDCGDFRYEDWRFVFGSYPLTHFSLPLMMPSLKLWSVSDRLMLIDKRCYVVRRWREQQLSHKCVSCLNPPSKWLCTALKYADLCRILTQCWSPV
jgi:hypothetical protein